MEIHAPKKGEPRPWTKWRNDWELNPETSEPPRNVEEKVIGVHVSKSEPKHELPIPPAALNDPRAEEMIRAWVAANGLQCSLNVGMWHGVHPVDEPSAWGILLADVIRHVSNAMEEQFGVDRRETLHRIQESLQIELGRPTSKVKGKFVEPKK